VAKKPTAKQVSDFFETLENLQKTGDLKAGDLSKGVSMYETGLMSKQKILDKLLDTKMSMSDAEYKMGTDLRGSKSIRETAKAKGKKLPKKLKVDREGMMYGSSVKKKKGMMGGSMVHGDKKKKDMMYGSMVTKKKKKNGMMGGGKVYASMNKRYANGGKIYPSKGKM
tara:strand:- start:15987 stop:16490 length:504 start_codon:yes stop_codon:yes gene_type:complete